LQNANYVDGIDVSFILRTLFVGEFAFSASVGELVDPGLNLGTGAHGGEFLSKFNGHHLADWFKQLAKDIGLVMGGMKLAHDLPNIAQFRCHEKRPGTETGTRFAEGRKQPGQIGLVAHPDRPPRSRAGAS